MKGHSWRAVVAGLGLAMIGVGCDAGNIIHDDFGIAGYARIRGTVSRANGSPWAGTTLRYSCGSPEPNWFGGDAVADAQGAFDVAVDAPVAGTLPPSGTLLCEVRVPNMVFAPSASARAVVAFSQSADARPVATFVLVEGQVVP